MNFCPVIWVTFWQLSMIFGNMWKGLPDPNFDTNFLNLQVSPCALWGRTLRILVFNIDVNRKHRIVGQTLLDLADVDLSQGKLVSIQIGEQQCVTGFHCV